MILMREWQLLWFHHRLIRKDHLEGRAGKIGVCYRQTKRIRQKVREKGAKGLTPGNRGKVRTHRFPKDVRQKIFGFISEKVR